MQTSRLLLTVIDKVSILMQFDLALRLEIQNTWKSERVQNRLLKVLKLLCDHFPKAPLVLIFVCFLCRFCWLRREFFVVVVQVKDLTEELKSLPACAQLAAAFITYLPSMPEDSRKEVMATWMDLASMHSKEWIKYGTGILDVVMAVAWCSW